MTNHRSGPVVPAAPPAAESRTHRPPWPRVAFLGVAGSISLALAGVAGLSGLSGMVACSRTPRGTPASHDAQRLAAAIRGEAPPTPAPPAAGAPPAGSAPRGPARATAGSDENSEHDGPARVIVELRMPEPSPGTTPRPFDSRSRKSSIADARTMLLGSLSPGSARLVRSYDTIPFVVLEVTPLARKALAASPLVKSVQVDRLMRPQDALPAPTPTATPP